MLTFAASARAMLLNAFERLQLIVCSITSALVWIATGRMPFVLKKIVVSSERAVRALKGNVGKGWWVGAYIFLGTCLSFDPSREGTYCLLRSESGGLRNLP